MKNLVIVGIVVGLLLIAGFGVVKAISNDVPEVEQEPKIETCSSCGNSCTATNNCGLSTCGAKTGGSCGCNKG